MRILLIDDDEQLMEVLASKLIEQHYAVDIANTGEMGWEFILLFDYDLVVLDLMLPDMDGITLCQQIRAEGYEMPIMLLTASDRHSEKVRGLDAGADDYVVKPFNFEELTARIRALLRRKIHSSSPILQWQNLSLNPKTHEVTYENQLLPLTPKEYALIELFMRHPNQVFSPSAIIDSLWAGEDPPGEEAVRTHIKGLRQKLKAAGMAKDTIQTVYGIGYRLKSDELNGDKLANRESNRKVKPKAANKRLISSLWSQFKEVAFARLAVLENLVEALVNQQVTQQLYQEAKSCAHKLAGSLGGFGFPDGSKIAKQIENLLVQQGENNIDIEQLTTLTISLKRELQQQPFAEQVKKTLNLSLLIISDNVDYTQQLSKAANGRDIKTYTASSLKEAREIMAEKSPSAILQILTCVEEEDLAFLEQLHQTMPQLPIVVIIEQAQLSDRLAIVHKGGNLILESPVEPSRAIAAVTELIESKVNGAKVLIVDDDSQVLLSLQAGLAPWGFEVTTLEEPERFWQVLETVQPDILVLDIEMPKISGIELCQILRSDRRWQHLPVLFLTAHQDEKIQHQAFAIGADDYICKPIIISELANRIMNRLRRSQTRVVEI